MESFVMRLLAPGFYIDTDVPFNPSWHSHYQRIGRDDRTFQNNGARADDGVIANFCTHLDDRISTDEDKFTKLSGLVIDFRMSAFCNAPSHGGMGKDLRATT